MYYVDYGEGKESCPPAGFGVPEEARTPAGFVLYHLAHGADEAHAEGLTGYRFQGYSTDPDAPNHHCYEADAVPFQNGAWHYDRADHLIFVEK